VAAYGEAARLAPAYADPLNGLGVLAVEKGDLEAAAAAFARVLDIEPGHHEARVNLAYVAARQGRLDQARGLLDEVLRSKVEADLRRRAALLLRDLPR
jgi:Flp pilus assembly protein TadD